MILINLWCIVVLLQEVLTFKNSEWEELDVEKPNHNKIMKREKLRMEGKVIDGLYTTIRNFPHSVFLFSFDKNSGWKCGSSILNQLILVTAAHCIHGQGDLFKMTVFAGATNIGQAKCVIDAKSYFIHENYSKQFDHVFADIALVLLKEKLTFGKKIKRVAITPKFPMTKDLQAFVAGWGKTSFLALEAPNRLNLKCVEQKVWMSKECSMYHKIVNGTLCAIQEKGGQPYKGDSGSGLVIRNRRHHLIGIVSYADTTKPDLVVYTNISYYYSWIKRTSTNLHCKNRN